MTGTHRGPEKLSGASCKATRGLTSFSGPPLKPVGDQSFRATAFGVTFIFGSYSGATTSRPSPL